MNLGEVVTFVSRGAMLADEPIPLAKEARTSLATRISDWISKSSQLDGNSGPYGHAVSDLRLKLTARQKLINSYDSEE